MAMAIREDEVLPLARQYFPGSAVAAAATANPKTQSPNKGSNFKFQSAKERVRFSILRIGICLGFGNWDLGFLGRVGFLDLRRA